MKSSILPLSLLILLAVTISLYIKIPYLLGIIFFYLTPGIYAAIKYRINVWEPILFSCLISIPFAIIVDYIGTASNLWIVPHSLFPLFLNILPFEDYIWMISLIFSVLMVSHVPRANLDQPFLNRKTKIFFEGSVAILAIFFALYFIYEQEFFVFNNPYLYLILASIFFGLPTFELGVHFKHYIFKYMYTVGYFFILTFVFESVAIYNSWWEFHGAYIVTPLTIAGKFLPLEELFFVGIIGPCMTILLYRFLLQSKTRN